MAGGTHVFDMLKRLRDNENLRKKSYFKVKNAFNRTAKSGNIDLRTATKEERDELRKRVIEGQRAEIQRSVKLLIVSITLTVILVALAWKFVLS